jgi:hypothetical protein
MSDVHEFITAGFKPDMDYDEQLATVRAVGERLAGCDGMRRRDYYFSPYARMWLAHVVWDGADAIEAANEVAERPEEARLFRRFDTRSITYDQYRLIGSHEGPAAS